jgi:cytochrome c oxidase subunit 3
MAATLESGAHAEHGLSYATRSTRARGGVLLLILSDATFILAMMASQVYLHGLNVQGQFHPHGEQPPSFAVGLIMTLVVAASAGIFYWGTTRLRNHDMRGFRLATIVAWVLMAVAMVGQIALFFSIRYPAPTHAYGSVVQIMTGYHAIHLFLGVLIGFLLIGRIVRGRIIGYEYVVQGAGYWWYYVAVAAAITWLFTALVG